MKILFKLNARKMPMAKVKLPRSKKLILTPSSHKKCYMDNLGLNSFTLQAA